jgi:DNA-binding response OmpR family regulator
MARVLFIDDDPTLRELLSLHLAADGHTVTTASDPIEGIRALLAQPPELVICEAKLPYLDGLELLAAIRGDKATAQIPVVMLTASRDENLWISALRLGADEYMVKPVKLAELQEAISRALLRPAIAPALFTDLARVA